MAEQTTTPTAQPGPHFPGADQASDYDEDVDTRTHGSRPRRSEQPTLAAPPADEPQPAADEDATASAARASRLPEQSERRDPLDSALFAGALTPHPASGAAPLARTGARGWLNRRGFHLTPGPEEQATLDRQAALEKARTAIRQATWTRAVSLMIANPKGGTGKTPLALLLGGTLASIRGGSVAVIEVADDPGALAYRAEGNPTRGIGDLVRDAADIRTAGQLAGYTAPQTSFAAVIGSSTLRPRLDADAVAAIVRVIDEYYAIRVMDSGNQPTSSAFQGALAATDVLVIPVVNAGDSTLEAIRMLEGLRAQGGHPQHLADRAIVARLTDGRPENAEINAEVARVMTAAGVAAICDLPYDPHIAERGQLTIGALAPATLEAFTRMAATVVGALHDDARQTETEVHR